MPSVGQEAVGTSWKTGVSPRTAGRTVCAGDRALAQMAQRLYHLDISKSYLDMVLGPLQWVCLPEQELGLMDPQVPANLSHFGIL